MKRSKYLNAPDVKDFIEWAANLVSGEWGLEQSYTNGKGMKFRFVSLYDAYENYDWPSKVELADGSFWHISSFDETAELFDTFRAEIKDKSSTGRC